MSSQASPSAGAEELPHDDQPPVDLRFLRWGLILCQAATIWVTWPLWQSRIDHPWMPHLPALPEGIAWLFQFDWGWLLLASLLWAAIHATSGIAVHGVLLALAIAVDQVRLQPEFVSLLILIAGTLPHRGLQSFSRWHLAALWFYAGFHKLLSEGYWEGGGARHLTESFRALDGDAAQVLAICSAIFEVVVGVLWLIPQSRLFAAVGAILLHFGILLSLVLQAWNVAVWPWNVALMMAAAGYSFTWREFAPISAWRAGWQGIAGAALLMGTPLLFYVGYFDSYLCHCLYSSNTTQAYFYREGGEGKSIAYRSVETVYVPFPPEHRLYEQYFRKVARPGDGMRIIDKRWYFHLRGWGDRWLEKPSEGESDAEIVERPAAEIFEQ